MVDSKFCESAADGTLMRRDVTAETQTLQGPFANGP